MLSHIYVPYKAPTILVLARVSCPFMLLLIFLHITVQDYGMSRVCSIQSACHSRYISHIMRVTIDMRTVTQILQIANIFLYFFF